MGDDAAEGRGRGVAIVAVQRGVVIRDGREGGDVLARDPSLAEFVGLAGREVLEAVRLVAHAGIMEFRGGRHQPVRGLCRGTGRA